MARPSRNALRDLYQEVRSNPSLGCLLLLFLAAAAALATPFFTFFYALVQRYAPEGTAPYVTAGIIGLVVSLLYLQGKAYLSRVRRRRGLDPEAMDPRFSALEADGVGAMQRETFERYVVRLLQQRGLSVKPVLGQPGSPAHWTAAWREGEYSVTVERGPRPLDEQVVRDALEARRILGTQAAMLVTDGYLAPTARRLARRRRVVVVDRDVLEGWVRMQQAKGPPSLR